MKVLIAPDSFKESISAADAAKAIRRGVLASWPRAVVDACPIADGGEGTVEAMVSAMGGERRVIRACGPLSEPVDAAWGMLGGTKGGGRVAIIEMSAAAGLHLVPPDLRNPERTTTWGVGEMIRTAMDEGATSIILGLGGSATCDGGCGMAGALGVRFCDAAEEELPVPVRGGDLARVRGDAAGVDPRVGRVQFFAACDVTNPLTGPNGAAHVFGPQKGATPEQVRRLDAGLRNLAGVVRRDLGVDIEHLPGAGAAGGLGGGAVAFLGATLRRGIDLVLDAVGFDERLRGCDLCITGEGRFDGQTAGGKAVAGVAAAARRRGVPVVALVGGVGPGWERHRELGVERVVVIGEGLNREESMRRAAELMEAAAARVMSKSV